MTDNLTVPTPPAWSLSRRVSRLLPRRHVLFANIRHGCTHFPSSFLGHFPNANITSCTEPRTLLLRLRPQLERGRTMQLITLTPPRFLHHSPWHLARYPVSPSLLGHPKRLPPSRQLWQIHFHHPLLYDPQSLPCQPDSLSQSPFHNLRDYKFHLLQ